MFFWNTLYWQTIYFETCRCVVDVLYVTSVQTFNLLYGTVIITDLCYIWRCYVIVKIIKMFLHVNSNKQSENTISSFGLPVLPVERYRIFKTWCCQLGTSLRNSVFRRVESMCRVLAYTRRVAVRYVPYSVHVLYTACYMRLWFHSNNILWV
jgi:hypothetical protein